jgi:hypothetical protein
MHKTSAVNFDQNCFKYIELFNAHYRNSTGGEYLKRKMSYLSFFKKIGL